MTTQDAQVLTIIERMARIRQVMQAVGDLPAIVGDGPVWGRFDNWHDAPSMLQNAER